VAGDARSFYTLSTELHEQGRNCGYGSFGAIARDVAAGSVVTRTLWVAHHCHGRMTIRVSYQQNRKPTQSPFMPEGFGKQAKVGTAVAKLP
jgi:hypothetical protein